MKADNLYAESGSRLKSNKIRELMKLAGVPGIISMAGGSPDAAHFPTDEIRAIMDGWDSKKWGVALQYGATSGYRPLVEQIESYVRKGQVKNSDLQILPTTGAQQAIMLLTRVFCDPGDVVIVELPSFIGALAVFISAGVELVGVEMDSGGMVIEDLAEKVDRVRSQGKKLKFVYTNPTFQNPSGHTMGQARRDSLYSLACEKDLLIVEDDPYYELYFEGGPEDYRNIKSRDVEDRVVLLNTFSKILSPGLRLGWLSGPAEIVSRCEVAKQGLDACSSSYSQVLAADYLAGGYVDGYTAKMRKIYAEKCSLMGAELKKEMPDSVSWSSPVGGFFYWVSLPEHVDSEAVLTESVKNKVAFVTGQPFHCDGKGRNKMRLAFSNSSKVEIIEGIGRLAETVRKFI